MSILHWTQATMSFNFQFVRQLQKGCAEAPIQSVDFCADFRLKEAKSLLDLNKIENAFSLLDQLIQKNQVNRKREVSAWTVIKKFLFL